MEVQPGPRPLRDLPLLLLLLLNLSLLLCSWLLAGLLCLLATAAAACRAVLGLLRGGCQGLEGLLGLPGLSGLRCGQALGVGTRLLMEPGRVCLAGTRSLSPLLGALWGSLAGSVLRVTEVLAAFLSLVATRATAPSTRPWLHCQVAFKLLCSATVVFLSVYFLLYRLAVVCHSAAQSLGTPVLTLWDSLTSLIVGVTDLLAAFLARVSSGAIAVSTLLWWLCQVALELLCSITKLPVVLISFVFTTIFYVLGLLLRIAFLIVFFCVICCNQEVLGVLKERVLGSLHRRQLHQVPVVTWHRAVTSRWRRLLDWVRTQWRRAGRRMNQGREQVDAGQRPQPRPARRRASRRSRPGAGQRHHTPSEEPGTAWGKAPRKQQLNATAGNAEGTTDTDPSALLKEQEEQKKCVICQDQTKTVLLLPCRHLCLCQECTEEILKRDIDEHNCPLCRQVIRQTLNVYL
ncbi:RNF26 ligase, partial [Zosterops hypoxanthus]|nr:RNF26 ligase [Zosterops hypoxanthus]